MTHIVDHEQDKIWESIQTLAKIDVDQARSVFIAALERSLQQFGLPTSAISTMHLSLPSTDDLVQLQSIEKSMRKAFSNQDEEKTYELLVDYIEYLSLVVDNDSRTTRKKLLTSLLLERHTSKKERPKMYRLSPVKSAVVSQTLSANPTVQIETNYFTPSEVAKKLGLSGQTIRRLCDKGKFEGAYKTDGGHWKIPQDAFITTNEQDQKAESVLRRIDEKNQEAGEVDEFDL
ncbi:helix-turn-helix domain-containing protein [Virgibacillus necropolis]|uniref:helix-turn-helix domain-containing protein n=1 Tax=Virgibacillus necropolis TaxID=163877 RepID=UPI00384F8FB6